MLAMCECIIFREPSNHSMNQTQQHKLKFESNPTFACPINAVMSGSCPGFIKTFAAEKSILKLSHWIGGFSRLLCTDAEPPEELVYLALSQLLKETDPRVSQQGLFANFQIPLNIFPTALRGKVAVELVTTFISKPLNVESQKNTLERFPKHTLVELFQAWAALSSTSRESIALNWGNESNFTKNGFGLASFVDNELTGYIYSSARSENQVETSLFVDEKFRGHGIGLYLAEEFAKFCDLKGLTLYWTCMSNNIPSLKIAKAIGLEKVSEEKFYYWKCPSQ